MGQKQDGGSNQCISIYTVTTLGKTEPEMVEIQNYSSSSFLPLLHPGSCLNMSK